MDLHTLIRPRAERRGFGKASAFAERNPTKPVLGNDGLTAAHDKHTVVPRGLCELFSYEIGNLPI